MRAVEGVCGTSHHHEHRGRTPRSSQECIPRSAAGQARNAIGGRSGSTEGAEKVQHPSEYLGKLRQHVTSERDSDLRKRGTRRSAKWVILP